jgi:hypothetical protein
LILTVTGDHQELVVFVDLVYLDVWECGDYLLLGWKIGALLEFEVTYRAGQGEVSVYATKVNEATRSLDACFLGCILSVKSGKRKVVLLPSFCGL